MIKTFYQEDIVIRLAAIFSYGLNKGYSYKAIEERVISSSFVNSLEKNKYDIESQIESIVESTYGISLFNSKIDISFMGLFFAESYFRLFLDHHKSFEYLFLYWSLSNFVNKYNVYHEMDFSNLNKDFESNIKETTLLRKLAKARQIKLTEISKLTGINGNTINRYARDDKYLYEASHENIYKLAMLFDVKENLFVSKLGVYLDQSIYINEKRYKDYRNYLGLLYANYFDERINKNDFAYDKENDYFVSNNGMRLIVISDILDNLTAYNLSWLVDSKTYLVVIPYGLIDDYSWLNLLKNTEAFEVFAITKDYIQVVRKKIKREITSTENRLLIIRAMEESSKI